MKRRKNQRIQDRWNGDKKWDKWSNRTVWRAVLTWLLLSSALMIPALVIRAILPTLFMLAEHGALLLRFVYAALALCALVPLEVLAWRALKDLFTSI